MRVRLVTALLAGALVIAACANDPSVVASVNGSDIESSEVVQLRDSFSEGVTLSGEEFRVDLAPVIYLEINVQAAADEWGIDIATDEQIDAKLANPSPQEASLFEQILTIDDRNEATVRLVAAQIIAREEVSKLLFADETFLKDFWESNRSDLFQVCVRHILVETEEDAITAKTVVDSRESFDRLALELSRDTASATQGGLLSCPAPAGAYVPEFAEVAMTAEIGIVSEPFETQFGWHILIVEERTGPESLEALLADPLAFLPLESPIAGEQYSFWFEAAVAAADVEVRSQVGVWDPSSEGILPPP